MSSDSVQEMQAHLAKQAREAIDRLEGIVEYERGMKDAAIETGRKEADRALRLTRYIEAAVAQLGDLRVDHKDARDSVYRNLVNALEGAKK